MKINFLQHKCIKYFIITHTNLLVSIMALFGRKKLWEGSSKRSLRFNRLIYVKCWYRIPLCVQSIPFRVSHCCYTHTQTRTHRRAHTHTHARTHPHTPACAHARTHVHAKFAQIEKKTYSGYNLNLNPPPFFQTTQQSGQTK